MTYQWDDKTKTYLPVARLCHNGNTKLYTEPNGGSLYIGGWSTGATFDWNTHVIDLTGTEAKWADMPIAYDDASKEFLPFVSSGPAGWLSLPFPDYKTPDGLTTRAQWDGITNVIRKLLKSGRDVLVACHGGHGRSGLFCAIVGYLLTDGTSADWESPVEHIRKVHCCDAVETLSQENFVYGILGLDLQPTRTYVSAMAATKSSTCPVCGLTNSVYTETNGMCFQCITKFKDSAPVVRDITEDDIKKVLPHTCTAGADCIGIYKASVCGHVVHDMLVIDGLCEQCAWEAEQKAKGPVVEQDPSEYGKCTICQRESLFGKKFGVCYDCAEELMEQGRVDNVHNSVTDAYRYIEHTCSTETFCEGIMRADVCGHVVHNQYIEDGKCEYCLALQDKVDKEAK